MASKAREDRTNRRQSVRSASIIFILIAYVVTVAMAALSLTPKRYDLHVGSTAPENITAPRNIEDTATTQAIKQAARNSVSPVLVIDSALVDSYNAQAQAYFNGLESVRTDARSMRIIENLSWDAALTDEQRMTLCNYVSPELTATQLGYVLNASDSDMLRLKEQVLPKLSTSLGMGLKKADVVKIQQACVSEINATTLMAGLKQIGKVVIENCLQATYVEDIIATETAREEAAEGVETIEIKKGEIIVEQGAEINETQLVILRELELVRQSDSDVLLYIGIALYLLVIYGVFTVYLFNYRFPVIASTKRMLIISAALIFTMLLAYAANAINPNISPGLIAVMMTALLVCERTALVVNVLIALCMGLIAGGRGTSMLQLDSMMMTVSSIVGGYVAVFILRRTKNRGAMIVAGALGGTAAAVTISAAYLMIGKPFAAVLEDAGWAIGSDIISAVLCVGTMSIWENVFDVATGARLSELSNTNQPLLRQLMTDAPGTYHHSAMAAVLAEAAAQRIGADALLARVGAYYHDVGKLRRPLYFMENQRHGENIHDTLPPEESAATIIAHQRDSVALLYKYKLPSSVIQIAHEHHGNTLVTYFYHKAVQAADGKPVSQKQFRYPGARPSSRESAIVMLADSCEAAVRSIPDADAEKVEEMVKKVVRGKMDDGQLNQSTLTLTEISEIEKSFLKSFNAIRHERIEYPDDAKNDRSDEQ